jgi:biopolymer transport protein ExbD
MPAEGSLRLAPRRRTGIHIDMTPMVDVAFLLVIFFMVTALFRKPQILDLHLPPPSSSAQLGHDSVMSVKVREDGRIFWQLGAGPLTEAPGEENLRVILAERAGADRDLVVLVKVDREAPYRRMVDVLDEVETAKLTRVTALPLEGPERDEVNGIL